MTARPLGDAANRSYADKLDAFDRFAEPEIRAAVDALDITPGQTVLDAGCGVGLVTTWLAEANGPSGVTIGMDLSRPHLLAAGRLPAIRLAQGDITSDPLRPGSFDLIWCGNTVNHVHDPVRTLRRLRQALGASGRLVLAQSGFLPEMYFAWDAGLDERVRAACLTSLCSLYVGNDTGSTHMVAAQGKKIVVIFGSSDFKVWYPWNTEHQLIKSDLPCMPCPGYFCLHYDEPRCIRSIPVEPVLEAVQSML